MENFRARVELMMNGTQKLKVFYPQLYHLFSRSDKNLDIEGENFHVKLKESKQKINSKFSLYMDNVGDEGDVFKKNLSLNLNMFGASFLDDSKMNQNHLQHQMVNSEQPRHANQSHDNTRNYLLPEMDVNSSKRSNLLFNLDKSSGLISPSCQLIFESNNDNNRQNTYQNEVNLTNIHSRKTSEFLDYEEMIEKTGQFNVIPDINNDPSYKAFRRELSETMQGKNQSLLPSVNSNMLSHKRASDLSSSLKSSMKESDAYSPSSNSNQLPNVPPLDNCSQIIEALKQNHFVWKKALSDKYMHSIIKKFKLPKIEHLFYILITIFEEEMRTNIPKYYKIKQKLNGKVLSKL